MIGIYKRIGRDDGIATSIVHLNEYGTRFKVSLSTTKTITGSLQQIRNDVIDSCASQRFVAALLGIGIGVILTICSLVFAFTTTNYAVSVGIPLIFVMVVCAHKWFVLNAQTRACERDADELVYTYTRYRQADFEERILRTDCQTLRRLVIDIFIREGSHV